MLKPYNEASLQPALRATSADLILHQWSRHRQGTKLHSRRRCNVNQNTIDWTKSSRRKMKMGSTLRPPQLASAKRQAWSQNDVRWEHYPLSKIDAESGGSGGSWEMLELCSKWGSFLLKILIRGAALIVWETCVEVVVLSREEEWNRYFSFLRRLLVFIWFRITRNFEYELFRSFEYELFRIRIMSKLRIISNTSYSIRAPLINNRRIRVATLRLVLPTFAELLRFDHWIYFAWSKEIMIF